MPWRGAAALLLAAAALAAALPCGRAWESARGALDAGTQAVITLEDKTVIQVQEFRGVSKWAALQHVFSTADVLVDCPGLKDFAVYVGPSVAAVRDAYARRERAWCGWERLLGAGGRGGSGGAPPCAAPVSPFGAAVVAVAKPPRGWISQAAAGVLGGGEDGAGGGAAAGACSMERHVAFSMPRFLAFVLGAWLFWAAPALATSTPFRLTGGTLGFVALSAAIVLFLVWRSVPHKRSVAVGTALLGSSALAAVRFLFGTWLPSMRQANTILRVALQLVGLGLVGAAPSSLEVSVALAATMLGTKLASMLAGQPTLRQALDSARARVACGVAEVTDAAAAAADAAAGSLSPGRGAAGAGAAPRRVGVDKVAAVPQRHVGAEKATYEEGFEAGLAAGAAAGGPSGSGAGAAATPTAGAPPEPEVSPLVQRGLILNEETGHLIQIGKGTYNRLLEAGYVVDRQKGVVTPPPGSPSPRKSSGGRRRR
eukprot:scaffold9.g3098.t1